MTTKTENTNITRLLPLTGGLLLSMAPLQAQTLASVLKNIGYNDLADRVGASLADGSGLSVSHVEGADGNGYYSANFSIANLAGKTVQYYNGVTPAGYSSHATTGGQYLYGSASAAPGIGTSGGIVKAFNANAWLTASFLRVGYGAVVPLVEPNEIQNHSWVATYGTTSLDQQALCRFDYAIDRDDFVAAVGLNNGSSTAIPKLLASSYNGIVVGLTNAKHSRGTTSIDSHARYKPDIVVPASATSWATTTVASVSGLLIDSAQSFGWPNGARSETVKALLLAGATRANGTFSRAWTHTSSRPLDSVFGAGELNIDLSHWILEAGEYDASTTLLAASTGWDFGSSSNTESRYYFFDLDETESRYEVSGALTWNRKVTPGSTWTYTLANLSLSLYSVDENGALLDQISYSDSSYDNVELIRETGLAPGSYAWVVNANSNNIDYGFAWHSSAE